MVHCVQALTGDITFRDKLSTECQSIYDYAVEKYEERKAEVQQMRDCIDEAINSSREHGTGLVNDFVTYKEEVHLEPLQLLLICEHMLCRANSGVASCTRNSAIAKSTARPSCLVGACTL